MKIVKQLSITSLFILLLAGCGEDHNKSVFGDSNTDAVITMSVGQSSEVLAGDIIEPNTASTRIQIDHVIDDDTKYVTILEGSATLLRGSYAVQ